MKVSKKDIVDIMRIHLSAFQDRLYVFSGALRYGILHKRTQTAIDFLDALGACIDHNRLRTAFDDPDKHSIRINAILIIVMEGVFSVETKLADTVSMDSIMHGHPR